MIICLSILLLSKLYQIIPDRTPNCFQHYLALVAQTLGSKKVESIALVLHGTPTAIHISGKDEKVMMRMV